MTKRDLARRVDVTEAAIAQWERGRRDPEIVNLVRLTSALQVTTDFLARDVDLPLSREEVSFRSLKSMPRRERDMATASMALASELARWIDERFRLPAVDIPDLSELSPTVAAGQLRRLWAIPDNASMPSLVQLMESKGVRCFALPDEIGQADALSSWHNGIPVVLFNVTKSAERSRNDAAHELGHLVLHRHSTPTGIDAEAQAIDFAGELLIPERALRAMAPHRGWNLSAILAAKRAWAVSAGFLLKRLELCRMVTEWDARMLWQQLSARGYRSGEPDGIPRETSLIIAKVSRLLSARNRSLLDAASEIGVRPRDVLDLTNGMMGMRVVDGEDRADVIRLENSGEASLKILR